MAMNFQNIVDQAKAELEGYGMKPDDVPFGTTGKGALELMITAISKAVLDEIVTNMEIKGVTVEVVTGSYVVSVTGGSGAPAVGIPNPAPVTHTQNNDGTGLVS